MAWAAYQSMTMGASAGTTSIAAPQAYPVTQTTPAARFTTGSSVPAVSYSPQMVQPSYTSATSYASATATAPGPVSYSTVQPAYAGAATFASPVPAPVSYSPQAAMPTYSSPATFASASPQYSQAVEYVSSAPAVGYGAPATMVEYIQEQAPFVEYIQQSAPMVEYIEQPAMINAQPTVIGASRNLLAMGNVVSERIVTPEELFDEGRLVEAPAEMAVASAPIVEYITQPAEYVSMAPPVEYVYEQPGIVEYVQQPQVFEYITGAPGVEYMVAPTVEYVTPTVEYVTGAPGVQYF